MRTPEQKAQAISILKAKWKEMQARIESEVGEELYLADVI